MRRLGLIGAFIALASLVSTACTNRPEKDLCDKACEKILDQAMKKKLKLARDLPEEEYEAVRDKLEQQKEDLIGKCSSECVVKATVDACECFIKAEKKSEIELCAKQYKNPDGELTEEDIPDDSIKDDKLEESDEEKKKDDDDEGDEEEKDDEGDGDTKDTASEEKKDAASGETKEEKEGKE